MRPVTGEQALPQVVGLQPIGVGRIAGAVVPAKVEGQEPRALAFQVRAEPHLVVIHCEVDDAATELEELLARIAVALVLLTASSTVCLVRLFFSSKVAIGRPLMKSARSSARCVSSRL